MAFKTSHLVHGDPTAPLHTVTNVEAASPKRSVSHKRCQLPHDKSSDAVSQSVEECRQAWRLVSGTARQCVPQQVTWVLPGTAANKIVVVVRWRFLVMACTEDWTLPCASQAAESHLSTGHCLVLARQQCHICLLDIA